MTRLFLTKLILLLNFTAFSQILIGKAVKFTDGDSFTLLTEDKQQVERICRNADASTTANSWAMAT